MKAGALTANAHEQLVQSVVDYAIYIIDLEGHVATWNAGAERIKGYSANEIIGEHFRSKHFARGASGVA